MWLLLIFWWGPNAGVITKQETRSKAICESMAEDIQEVNASVEGTIHTVCIKGD